MKTVIGLSFKFSLERVGPTTSNEKVFVDFRVFRG